MPSGLYPRRHAHVIDASIIAQASSAPVLCEKLLALSLALPDRRLATNREEPDALLQRLTRLEAGGTQDGHRAGMLGIAHRLVTDGIHTGLSCHSREAL